MPTSPPAWCAKCRSPQPRGHRCTDAERAYNQQRGTSTNRGYDLAWRTLRLQALRRDAWRCVLCGWEPAIVQQCRQHGLEAPEQLIKDELRRNYNANTQWLEVDHVLTIDQHPELRLSLSNLRTLCRSCHSARTIAEASAR